MNTIEEEKHETQTSNYFREGDSERDDSKMNYSYNLRGSKILNEITNESQSPSKPNAYVFKGSDQKDKEEEYESDHI